MRALKRAAHAALERSYAGLTGRAVEVDRLSLDIALNGQREVVSFRMRDGALSWSCSCAEADCAHAQAGLAYLLDAEPTTPEDRITEPHESPAGAPSDRRVVAESDQPASANTGALTEALSDLLIAVARAGADGGLSASVDEGLTRLRAAAPSPLPLGVARWIGRLKQAIAEHDADELARVLDGGGRLLADLGAARPAGEGRQRVLSWLGALSNDGDGVTRVSDLTLIEIAREWLPGVERAGVERRYLIDLADGQIYREERAAGAQTASLGPCPRLLTVWLAVVEESAPPKRIRLLQYAVTPVIEASVWEALAPHAVRDFASLLATYRGALGQFAGLTEPFATLAVSRIDAGGLVGADGQRLPLLCPDNASLPRYLETLAQDGEPLWVAGRLADHEGLLGLTPLAAALRRRGRVCYERL
jgi:hypothetical protein